MSISGFFKKIGSQIEGAISSATDKIKAEARRFDDRIIQPVIKPIAQTGVLAFVSSVPIVGGLLGGITSSLFGGPEMAIENRIPVAVAGPETTAPAPAGISPQVKQLAIVAALVLGGVVLLKLASKGR